MSSLAFSECQVSSESLSLQLPSPLISSFMCSGLSVIRGLASSVSVGISCGIWKIGLERIIRWSKSFELLLVASFGIEIKVAWRGLVMTTDEQ